MIELYWQLPYGTIQTLECRSKENDWKKAYVLYGTYLTITGNHMQ